MAPSAEADTAHPPRRNAPRQVPALAARIVAAFHHACDVNDALVAERLLHSLETVIGRQDPAEPANRRAIELLVAAHDRFWHMRRRMALPWEQQAAAD